MIQVLSILAISCIILLVLVKYIEIRKTISSRGIEKDKSKIINLKSKINETKYIRCSLCSGSGYTHIRLASSDSNRMQCPRCLGKGYQIEPKWNKIRASSSGSGCTILLFFLCTSLCLILILGLKFI